MLSAGRALAGKTASSRLIRIGRGWERVDPTICSRNDQLVYFVVSPLPLLQETTEVAVGNGYVTSIRRYDAVCPAVGPPDPLTNP
jgi:hypothetical protein